MAQLDFSPIGDLYNTFRQSQRRAAEEERFGPLGMQGALSLAQLNEFANRNRRDERDYGLREKQFELTKRTAEAGLEGSKVPQGWRALPGGGLEPIPQGPADPEYIRRVNEAKDKGKQFNAGEITKLVEEGGKFANLTNFTDTFQDRYAGYKVPMAGSAAMTAGRYLPEGVVGKDVAEGAGWWQGYDRYKNVVRNELFGSALTTNEQAAFERADISPGMEPAQIRRNLATQQSILKDAMKRKAGALIAGGYQPEPISRAFGLKLEDLGVDTTRRGAQPQAAPGAQPQAGQPPVPGAKQGRKPDGSPGWFIQSNGKTYLVE